MRVALASLSLLFVAGSGRAEPPTAAFPMQQPAPAVAPAAQSSVTPPRAPTYHPAYYYPRAAPPTPRDATPPKAPGWRWGERPLTVLIQAAFGSPIGNGGVLLEWNACPWFAVSAGAGVSTYPGLKSNLSARTVERASPWQLAAGARVRAPTGAVAASVGLGLSHGGYEARGSSYEDSNEAELYIWDDVTWFNFDIGLERRAPSGVQWRVFIGRGRTLGSPAPDRCQPTSLTNQCAEWPREPLSIILLGFAFGYAFEL